MLWKSASSGLTDYQLRYAHRVRLPSECPMIGFPRSGTLVMQVVEYLRPASISRPSISMPPVCLYSPSLHRYYY